MRALDEKHEGTTPQLSWGPHSRLVSTGAGSCHLSSKPPSNAKGSPTSVRITEPEVSPKAQPAVGTRLWARGHAGEGMATAKGEDMYAHTD